MSEAQLKEVAKKFGLDPAASYIDSFENTMNSNDFVASLKEPLSAKCLALVEKIWGLADANQSGFISREEIKQRYDSR